MSQTKRKKAETKTKTVAQLVYTCKTLRNTRYCKACMGKCEYDDEPTFLGRWVSEVEHNKLQGIIEMKTIKIEALQLAILSIYKPQIQILERRLELIKKYIEELSGWCGDEGCRAFKELGVLLSEPKELDQKTREGDIK